MENGDVFAMVQAIRGKAELTTLLACNEKTAAFGLALTEEAAKELVVCRNASLKKHRRVEFGEGILDRLIFEFCDSSYVDQDNYLATLERLQDVFYAFKNESEDKLTDDELLAFMREQFEGVCFGDLDYLEGTCLPNFAAAIRAGYDGYRRSSGKGEYARIDDVVRWDKEVYLQTLRELFWE